MNHPVRGIEDSTTAPVKMEYLGELNRDPYALLDNLIMEQEQEQLADALEKLTREERDLIILHYYNEYTLLKVAELMRRPYGQIKRLHMKALQKMKFQMA